MDELDAKLFSSAGGDELDAKLGITSAGTGPAAGFRQPKTRSALGEIATGLRTGVTEEIPLQAGQALQWMGTPSGGGFRQSMYDTGKGIADAAKARQQLPENQLQPDQHNIVTNALAEGGKMLAPSVAAPALIGAGVAAVGAAAPELAVGGAVGLGISSVLGAAPAAMQQGQQTYENVKEAGGSEEAARAAGWKNLAIEGAGESLGTYVGGKFVGAAGKALGKAAAPGIAGTIEGATDKAILKPFAKNLVETALVETGTEIGQAGGEALVEKNAGVDTDPLKEMKGAVAPTLGMTALLAPFGLHANYRNSQNAARVDAILADPSAATPEERTAVVDELHKQAVANKVPDASQWLAGAKEDIAAGLPVRRTVEAPADPVKDKVQETALNNLGVDGTVENGEVTIDGVTKPVAEAAKNLLKGEPAVSGKVPDTVLSSFPDMVTADSGLINLNQFSASEQDALRSAGLVESGATSTGETHNGVDPEKLWPLRQQRQKELSTKKAGGSAEERNTGIENRALYYDRLAKEQEDLGELGDKQKAATYRAKAQQIRNGKTNTNEASAPPAVEELPMRPGMPTTTNLRVGEEVWSYRPPEGMTKENVDAATQNLSPAGKLEWFKANSAPTFRNLIAEKELNNATAQQVAPAMAEAPVQTQGGAIPLRPVRAQAVEGVSGAAQQDRRDAAAPQAVASRETPAGETQSGLSSTGETQQPTQEVQNGQEQGRQETLLNQSTPQASTQAPPEASSPRGVTSSEVLNSAKGLTNPLRTTSAEVPKFKSQAEVDAYKAALRAKGYDGVYLTDKQQSFALDAPAKTGATTESVAAEVKGFLGVGYDNLVRRGKIEVVQSLSDAKATGIPMRGASGKVAGIYNPKLKKVVLIADNIEKGDGQFVMLHEGAHALLREDAQFVKQKEKIIADFLKLAKNSESVRAAIARVPESTKPEFRNEEALAHWLQDKNNHQRSLFKRIISAVKAALIRLGIPVGRFTEADLSRMFVEGVKDWSMQESSAAGEFSQSPLFSLKEAGRKIQNLPAFKKWFAGSKVVDSEGKPLVVYHGTPFGNFRDRAEAINSLRGKILSEKKSIDTEFRNTFNATRELKDELRNKLGDSYVLSDDYRVIREMEISAGKDHTASIEKLPYIPRGEDVADIFKYTGTNDSGYLGRGFYFTGDKNLAGDYAKFANRSTMPGESRSPYIYEVYLSLKNPFYEGKTKFTSEMAARENELYNQFKPFRSTDVDALLGARASARSAMLKEFGFDGIIGESAGKEGIEYVAFDSSQIKSIFNDKWDGSNPDILESRIDDIFKAGHEKLAEVGMALANPKNKFHNFYLQHADKWLGVLPSSFIAQAFKRVVPQLATKNDFLNKFIGAKAKWADDFKDLYDAAMPVIEKGPGLKNFNDALLVGTYHQMYPWQTADNQDWVTEGKTYDEKVASASKAWNKAGMKKATGKTYEQAHEEAWQAWKKLGKSAEAEALKIVDYMTKLRQRERDNLLALIESISSGNPELGATLRARFDATFSNIKGIYMPLSRYGDFILKFTDKDGVEQVLHFETSGEQVEMAREVANDGATGIVLDQKRENVKGETVIPQALIDQLISQVRKKFLVGVDEKDTAAVARANEEAQSVITDLHQTILRWLPDTSALKNAMRRKSVSGADRDMLRSAVGYVNRHASSIAWMEYGRKIENVIASIGNDIKADVEGAAEKGTSIDVRLRTAIWNNERKWLQAVRNETIHPLASFLGFGSTAYFMTSPSTFLVQLTQLPALTLPNLVNRRMVGNARIGWAKASAALSKGFQQAFHKDYAKEAMLGDASVNAVYDLLHRRVSEGEESEAKPVGSDYYSEAEKATAINKLSDYQKKLLMLREAIAMNLLDISAVHEMKAIAAGREGSTLGKVMDFAMKPMQYGELGSRKAAALATFDLAMQHKLGFFEALGQVQETIDKTLFTFTKEDKGHIMQGSVPRTLGQFQTYRINTALRLGLLLYQSIKGETKETQKAAWQEFTGIAGMSALLGGANGLVFGSLIFGVASLLGGSDDEPFDARLAFTNQLKGTLGDTAGEVAMFGIFRLLGMNLSNRIGMGDIVGMQSEPPENLHGAALAAWYAGNLLGPSFSVAQSWVKGYDEMVNKGNYMKGLEAATPKPIKDALKAVRVAEDGLKDGQGKRLIADDKIDAYSIPMLALGFRPDEIAAAEDASFTEKKLSTQLSERRGRLIHDAAKALVNSEDTDGPMNAIREFNQKQPMFAIWGKDIKPAIHKLVLGDLGVTGKRERQVAQEFGVPVYQ